MESIKARERYIQSHARVLSRTAEKGYGSLGRGAVVVAEGCRSEEQSDIAGRPHYMASCFLTQFIRTVWMRRKKRECSQVLFELQELLPSYDPSSNMIVAFLHLDGRVQVHCVNRSGVSLRKSDAA